MRVMCEFCHERVLKNQLKLHYKRCIRARKALKKQIGFAKIEEPTDLISQETESQLIEDGNLSNQLLVDSVEDLSNEGVDEEDPDFEKLLNEKVDQPPVVDSVEDTGKKKKRK